MIQKYLILVDENPQADTLKKIKDILAGEGIDLVYEEYNPTNYQKRYLSGDVDFDVDRFKNDIQNVEYFKFADIILCDYNLIPNVVNGYDIIKIIRNLNYTKKRKIILYSAKIEGVISDILMSNSDFEKQKENLVNLINCNIEFTKRDGYVEEVIKNIKKEKEFDFEEELIKWFYKRDKDVFNYLFPKYKGKSFGEIAVELESKTSDSIYFKKELIEQIVAYLSTINDLESA